MKNFQTLGAALLLMLSLSMTAFADCPTGGIISTGGTCTNGIIGPGSPSGRT